MWKLLSKKSRNYEKVYKSIDELPVKKWFAIHKDGDFTHIAKSEKDKKAIRKWKELPILWEKIYNEYIQRFGLPDEFISMMKLKNDIAIMQADLIITGKKHFKTLIEIKKQELKKDSGIEKPKELDSILAIVSKWYGFHVNSNKITVSQYYAYIKEIKNG